eukprot:11191965-Lingulodinium_polyedra.AAC.1
MDTCTRQGPGASPWFLTHGEDLRGELIPFGAKAVFHPNVAKGARFHKCDPPPPRYYGYLRRLRVEGW